MNGLTECKVSNQNWLIAISFRLSMHQLNMWFLISAFKIYTFSVHKMLSFIAATSIVFIISSYISISQCGPLDWAKVEVPWARADRSKWLKENVKKITRLIQFFFQLQFQSTLICRGCHVSSTIDHYCALLEETEKCDCVECDVLGWEMNVKLNNLHRFYLIWLRNN